MSCRFLTAVVLVSMSLPVFAEDSTRSLFDGDSLAGWTGNSTVWRVEENAITAEIADGASLDRNEFLFWNGEIGDFDLSLEFRISGRPDANSGIQFRSQQHGGDAAGYQADLDQGATWLGRIYDEHGRALIVERGTMVSIAPDGRRWVDPFAAPESFASLIKPNDWNTYRIIASGPHVELWINGRRAATLDDHQVGEADYSGKLALQLHSGLGPAKVQFRNILLTDRGRTEFPATAAVPADRENRQSESPVLWQLRPNPATQSPIDNAEAQAVVANMKLQDGFEAELIAAEPDIHQPIAFAIDERGRLWVVEAFSYPNKQPEGEGKDRIRILEDRDGDGVFESRKTFTEGLNLVSGIEVGFGGVWIGAAPQLLFIPDADGDDVPDGPPQVLLDGFGYQDTHETLNSFVWGPDGWLYGNQGVFNTASIGKPGTPDEERATLRAGVWRYHPVRHEFEVFAHGGSNQWGLGFNAIGDLFMTHCRSYWGGGGTTHVIRSGHFWNQTNSNYPDFISGFAPEGIPALQNYLPASARYDSGEGGAGKPGTGAVYGGHSHVGTMIYGGDNWPEIYRDHLFTHNLHGHQINHQVNVRQRSGYETFHAGYDIAYVPDPAYVAVDLKYGPDGAVYIIDWVDRQHCHNPRPENWDRTNGRMYRLSWAATYRPAQVDLSASSDAELATLLTHRNRWFVNTARRVLQHRATLRPIDAQVLDSLRSDAAQGSEQLALDSLWGLHATGQLTQADIAAALTHPADSVRAAVIQLATERADSQLVSVETLLKLATDDPSAKVRLAVASAMPNLEESDRWQIGEALAAHPEDAGDRFLPRMIWYGLAPVVARDVDRAVALSQATPLESLSDSIDWFVARQPAGRERLMARIAGIEPEVGARLIRLIHFSLQNEPRLERPAGWDQLHARLANHPACAGLVEELSAVFGDEAELARMRSRLTNASLPLPQRRHALSILTRVGDRACVELYSELLQDAGLRPHVLPLTGRSADPAIATTLLASLSTYTAEEKAAALGVLSSRAAFATDLLRAIESGELDRKELSALQIRQIHNLASPELTERLEKIYGKIGVSSDEAKALIVKLRQTYTAAPLWAFSEDRGREVFQKRCAVCHPLDGSSIPLGPSLKGSWRNGLDYFLENVVDPNAVVGENYRMTLVVTESGEVVSGLLDSETDQAVILRTAEKTITVPKSEIEERRLVDQSLMPTGLLDQLSEIEVIELLKFLLRRE